MTGWSEAAVVDPVTVLVAALDASALKGAGESATTAVEDTYSKPKELVATRVARHSSRDLVLAVMQVTNPRI